MTPVAAILEQLLAVTPPPPPAAASDAQSLVAAADHALQRRHELIASAGGSFALSTAGEVALFQELVARVAAWHDALSRVQAGVGNQLIAMRRARAYTQR
jgi:glutamate-1-semialdehyde aminotransferase